MRYAALDQGSPDLPQREADGSPRTSKMLNGVKDET